MRKCAVPIDDTPAGKMLEGFLSTIAQFENDEKSVRTKRGMKEALERGTWPFPVALGYSKVPQEDGRSKVVQDPVIAPLIKQAFGLYATGRYQRAEVLRIVTAGGFGQQERQETKRTELSEPPQKSFLRWKACCG